MVERVGSPHALVDTVKSNDSDKTLSGSSDSIGTAYRLDSQDSTTSVEGDGVSTWSSGRQMSIREWDIPYEELKIMDKIGSGRFSTVHMGNWHGDVAIKVLDVDNLEDETTALEAFKLDVATFRKTRHENLVLFMGACMKPPKLAIVTSLCKGNTLYTHLHLRKDKFFMNKIIIIAQQIALGMGYLHHRGIVHKDLKTKNIFLENGRAIIADFGLVNVARRLCSRYRRPGDARGMISECMSIPAGWLCYLAPEVIRELRVHQTRGEDLPFTRSSDVYAFGTVWYELLTGEWPWKHRPPESIIWQVGHGIKPTLANLQASREVKDILVQCWLFSAERRPDFEALVQSLEKLPKKRLARSPSHPIHLSRSAESVF
jgi:kinase suppressor of Ras 2